MTAHPRGALPHYPILPDDYDPAIQYVSVYRDGQWRAEPAAPDQSHWSTRRDAPRDPGVREGSIGVQNEGLQLRWLDHPIFVSFTGNLLALAVYWLVTR